MYVYKTHVSSINLHIQPGITETCVIQTVEYCYGARIGVAREMWRTIADLFASAIDCVQRVTPQTYGQREPQSSAPITTLCLRTEEYLQMQMFVDNVDSVRT